MVITVTGTGYVGLSNAVILAQHNKVYAVDIIPEKVEMLNARKSPIADAELEDYLANKPLDLTATLDGETVYKQSDYFEYDKDEVNKFKQELHDQLVFQTNVKVDVIPNEKFESFKEAVKRKKVTYYPDKKTADQANNKVKELYNSKQLHLSALKTFLDYSTDFDEIGY